MCILCFLFWMQSAFALNQIQIDKIEKDISVNFNKAQKHIVKHMQNFFAYKNRKEWSGLIGNKKLRAEFKKNIGRIKKRDSINIKEIDRGIQAYNQSGKKLNIEIASFTKGIIKINNKTFQINDLISSRQIRRAILSTYLKKTSRSYPISIPGIFSSHAQDENENKDAEEFKIEPIFFESAKKDDFWTVTAHPVFRFFMGTVGALALSVFAKRANGVNYNVITAAMGFLVGYNIVPEYIVKNFKRSIRGITGTKEFDRLEIHELIRRAKFIKEMDEALEQCFADKEKYETFVSENSSNKKLPEQLASLIQMSQLMNKVVGKYSSTTEEADPSTDGRYASGDKGALFNMCIDYGRKAIKKEILVAALGDFDNLSDSRFMVGVCIRIKRLNECLAGIKQNHSDLYNGRRENFTKETEYDSLYENLRKISPDNKEI